MVVYEICFERFNFSIKKVSLDCRMIKRIDLLSDVGNFFKLFFDELMF